MRNSVVNRSTKETKISCSLELDGSGIAIVDTKIGFFDHMLNTLAKHASFDINFSCEGDLNVDTHHSVEDSGIVLGLAFKEALKSKDGIKRYVAEVVAEDFKFISTKRESQTEAEENC